MTEPGNELAQLMVSTGKLLKDNEFVSPIDLQKYYSENFGYNPTLAACRCALSALEVGNFLEAVHENIYTVKYKIIIKQTVNPTPHYGANPLYFPQSI